MTVGVISQNKYCAASDAQSWGFDDAVIVLKTPRSVQKLASSLDKIYLCLSDSDITQELMSALRDAVGDNVYRLKWKYNEQDWRKPIPLPPVKI